MLVLSITDSENKEPNLAKPIKDTEEPIRAKLRSDIEDPRCK
jgi:hypothetical protein